MKTHIKIQDPYWKDVLGWTPCYLIKPGIDGNAPPDFLARLQNAEWQSARLKAFLEIRVSAGRAWGEQQKITTLYDDAVEKLRKHPQGGASVVAECLRIAAAKSDDMATRLNAALDT